jgi:hypothetical protein
MATNVNQPQFNNGPGATNTEYVGGASTPTINPNAYQNPVGNQAGNWNQGMQNMLGATTGAAPQMGQTNIGGPAQIGQTATYGGAGIQANQFNQSYGQEGHLANQLGAMAAGYGPSLAQAQAQQGAQSALNNQMAAAASQRGSSNPALAAYQAQQMGAQAQGAAAQQAVQGRISEQMGAMGQQGSVLGNMNGQASSFATNQAQLQQQAQLASMGAINSQNLSQAQMMQQNAQAQGQLYQGANQANMGAQLSQNSLNAQQYNNYMSMLQSQNMAQYQGQMEQQAQQSQNYLQALGISSGNAIAGNNLNATIAGSGAGLASGLVGVAGQAASDIHSKKNIRSADRQLGEVLEAVYNSRKFKSLLIG